MNVRNLTTLSDEEFLQQSINSALNAIEKGNAPVAQFWARHSASFAVSSGMLERFESFIHRRFANWFQDAVMQKPDVTVFDWQNSIES